MKKLILTPLFILFALISFSQEWFPVGAHWTYGWSMLVGPYYNVYPRYYEVQKDTVFLGESCKKIVIAGTQHGASYRYYENNKVYYASPVDTTWNLMYDFSKDVGDTIFYPQIEVIDYPNTNDTTIYYVVIDNISIIIIGGDTLKSYSASPLIWCIDCGYFGTSAIERVSGGEVQSYGQAWLNEGPLGLRCYQDSILGAYKTPGFQLDCDTAFTINNTSIEGFSSSNISFFPNPASDILNIEISSAAFQKAQISIYDIRGKQVFRKALDHVNVTINLDQFESGLYIYEIESAGTILRDKLIIQK